MKIEALDSVTVNFAAVRGSSRSFASCPSQEWESACQHADLRLHTSWWTQDSTKPKLSAAARRPSHL